MKLGMRWLRLRAVWILIVPFLWLASPTPSLLAAGAGVAVVGLGIRAWAAGHIRKERELTTRGPYAHTRNPLYLGSFFVGLGFTIAGGRWLFVILFLAFFWWIYGRTIRGEAELLERRFGDEYRRYAERVPLVVPRAALYRAEGWEGAGFDARRWRQNREYEALAGALAGFAFLVAKMMLMGTG
jgi:protein-S-isoprenylcysteine O-methyltransferase Ste14